MHLPAEKQSAQISNQEQTMLEFESHQRYSCPAYIYLNPKIRTHQSEEDNNSSSVE